MIIGAAVRLLFVSLLDLSLTAFQLRNGDDFRDGYVRGVSAMYFHTCNTTRQLSR